MKLIVCTILLFTQIASFANTIRVDASGGANALGQAIITAAAGDTILVAPGKYYVNGLKVTKPLTIIGAEGAVLDGSGKHEIFVLRGRNIKVSGFTFQNSGYSSVTDMAAITIVDASHVVIEKNQFEQTYFGVHAAGSSNFVVRNNSFRGVTKTEQTSGNGIHLWKCDKAIVENNNLSGHRDGIYFEFVTNSRIIGNVSYNNIRYGLHFMFSNDDFYSHNVFRDNGAGVAVMFSNRVTMIGNEFRHNWGAAAYGLLLKEINDSKIDSNLFLKNTIGIYMEGANRIHVDANQFIENGWAARVQASSSDNTFTGNNFMGNTFDVATNGSMVLNHFTGNYWDKYEGYDRNRDGVGDVPYHPVSLYSMLIEQNSNSLILLRSFMITLLDKAERAIPSLTPVELNDASPKMKMLKL